MAFMFAIIYLENSTNTNSCITTNEYPQILCVSNRHKNVFFVSGSHLDSKSHLKATTHANSIQRLVKVRTSWCHRLITHFLAIT